MTSVDAGNPIESLAASSAFRPRQRFRQLVHDHVPFDRLVGRPKFEAAALRSVTDDSTTVAVVGPRGGGKSSLIAHVCDRLPDDHVALRVPVAGADDPTSTSVIAAVALSGALDTFTLERSQREVLEGARADRKAFDRGRRRLGGKLGGGPVPAALHADLGTMRKELDQVLVDFYSETGRSFRHTLAALDTATAHAADDGASRIELGHLRAATAEWRDRVR